MVDIFPPLIRKTVESVSGHNWYMRGEFCLIFVRGI